MGADELRQSIERLDEGDRNRGAVPWPSGARWDSARGDSEDVQRI